MIYIDLLLCYYSDMTAKIYIANTNMCNQIGLLGRFSVDSKIHHHIVISRDTSSIFI